MYLQENKTEIEPVFLNSGFYYDSHKKTYIREENRAFGAQVFSIVNSPVIAPMRAPVENLERMVSDNILVKQFEKFLDIYGPFDAIHFQTLEGLSLKVLKLKEKYEKTIFLYSMHNYTLFCPNVMFWTERGSNCVEEKEHCECGDCIQRYRYPPLNMLKSFRRLANGNHPRLYYYTRGIKFLTRKISPNVRRSKKDIISRACTEYRKISVDLMNEYCDHILAVSCKVRDIAVEYGVEPNKVIVSYIGTKAAENAKEKLNVNPNQDPFGILYMGYMKEEKGFYFLLDALEKMEGNIAKNITVTFAAKITSRKTLKRLFKLKNKFSRIRIFDGYSHNEMPDIVSGCHLGIVPVLWEDNLPQVAIEMIANGLPVLASSFGGASELNTNTAFRFQGGNADDFLEKLYGILKDRSLLEKYWDTRVKLTSMEMHIAQLSTLYNS